MIINPTGQRNSWPPLIVLLVGYGMVLLDTGMVTVAQPVMMEAFATGADQIRWVTGAFLVTFTAQLLVSGRLGDRFGPKRIYLGGLAVFTVTSLLCAFTMNVGQLIVIRAVQGIGAALLVPQILAVAIRTLPVDRRGSAIGVLGSVTGLAALTSLVGPTLGGALVDEFSWRWVFLVNVPIGIVAFILAAWLVPALEGHRSSFDVLGAALASLGIFLLVVGLTEGDASGWTGPIWLIIAAGVVVIGVFVVAQRRTTREPLLPLPLLRDRDFVVSSLAIVCSSAAAVAMVAPVYYFLYAVREITPVRSALMLVPMALLAIVLAPLAGMLIDRIHPRILPTIGFTLYLLAAIGFAQLMDPDRPVALFSVVAAIAGIGSACLWPSLVATMTRNVPAFQAGAGAGAYNTVCQIGTLMGAVSINTIVSTRIALQESAYLAAAISVLGFAAALLLVRSSPRRARAVADPDTRSHEIGHHNAQ